MARLESPKKLFKRARGDVARLRQRLLNGERDASSVVKALYEGRQKRIEADYDRNKVLLKQKHADERAYLASYQAAEAAQKRVARARREVGAAAAEQCALREREGATAAARYK